MQEQMIHEDHSQAELPPLTLVYRNDARILEQHELIYGYNF